MQEGKPMKHVRKVLGTATAAVGALAFAASPASAAPYWQVVSTDSNWSCSTYQPHQVSNNVNFKTCIVRNANNDAQAVLVVQNKATVAITIRGELTYTHDGFSNYITCKLSTLNPGFTRGCFAPTETDPGQMRADTVLWVNGSENGNYDKDSWIG